MDKRQVLYLGSKQLNGEARSTSCHRVCGRSKGCAISEHSGGRVTSLRVREVSNGLVLLSQLNPTEKKITFRVIGLERDQSGRESHKVKG